MRLTRRELLEMAALLAVAPPQDEVERRAADTIRADSAEGHHRTATAVDRASADALLARARATGAQASLQPFDLSRVDTAAAYLQIQGQRFEGLPMFDGAFIGANAWFHNPKDLWPDAVDIAAVARFARATADLAVSLASTPVS